MIYESKYKNLTLAFGTAEVRFTPDAQKRFGVFDTRSGQAATVVGKTPAEIEAFIEGKAEYKRGSARPGLSGIWRKDDRKGKEEVAAEASQLREALMRFPEAHLRKMLGATGAEVPMTATKEQLVEAIAKQADTSAPADEPEAESVNAQRGVATAGMAPALTRGPRTAARPPTAKG